MQAKALDLFKAYADGQLPSEGGYIVSSFLDENSSYARYEVIAYNGVKTIYMTEEGQEGRNAFNEKRDPRFLEVPPAALNDPECRMQNEE